jgi:hypothetical protein
MPRSSEFALKPTDEARGTTRNSTTNVSKCKTRVARAIYIKHELDLPLIALYHLLVSSPADREDCGPCFRDQ